jgi:signal transduction histidine kinase
VDEAAGRPILGLWRSWRGLGLDVAVASLATWLNLFEAFYAPPGPVLQTTSDMVVLTVAAGAVLLLRRRFPVPVALIVVAATAIGRTFLPEVVALYTVASFTRSRRDQLLALGVAATALVVHFLTGLRDVTGIATAGLFVALPVAVGFYVAARGALTESLMEKAARLERERDLLAERARSEERARVAREMHDVVAHRMSLVVLHAGALEVRPANDPEVAETAKLIRSIGHQALQELRQVVGLLRTNGVREMPLAPQPTLDDLDELVEHSRAAGVEVALQIEGPHDRLDQRVERAVYRLVQEALTNVHRHGAGRVAEVCLSFGTGEIEVTVTNPASAGPSVQAPTVGGGLLGLSERVEMLGGTFEAGPTPDRSFRVHARIPRVPVEVAR